MKRPNAIIHMALWGGVTGWLTAALMLLTLNIIEVGGNDIFTASALFGGISGMFMGFISGIIIHWMLDNSRKEGFEALRSDTESMVSSFAFIGMIIMLFSFRIPLGISFLYVTIIPIMLMLGTARYFIKIKPIFAEIQLGIKAKNRLSAKPKQTTNSASEEKKEKKAKS
jgi:hypothetical protein